MRTAVELGFGEQLALRVEDPQQALAGGAEAGQGPLGQGRGRAPVLPAGNPLAVQAATASASTKRFQYLPIPVIPAAASPMIPAL